MEIKKASATIALALSIFTTTTIPYHAEARIILTPQQEQQVGWGQITYANVAYQDTNLKLKIIQDSLIRWNKDKLTAYTNDNSRGLRNPHLLVTNRSKVNAYSLPGGHIFLSDALITAFMSVKFDPNTGVPTGAQKENEFGNGYELYGHSAIAATIAHEDSHWVRNFLQKETDTITSMIGDRQENDLKLKLQVGDGRGFSNKLDELGFTNKVFPKVKKFVYDEEIAADKMALELLDNTDAYSPGSLMTVVTRMKDPVDKPDTLPHPKAIVRKQLVVEHINRISHGRVQLDEDGRMMLDGKLFMGTGYLPARQDVTEYDRTVYVAGQLAKCIHNNAKELVPMVDSHAINRSKGMIPVVAVNRATRKRFVVDKFNISEYDMSKLVTGQHSSSSAENSAVREIQKFLHHRQGVE